jgi:hypothetical protein
MRQTSIQIGFVLVLFAPFLSGCIGWIGRPVDAESQTRNLRIETIQATEPSADGATIVHIDPQTGQITVPPMAAPTVKPNNRRSTLWRCRPYEKQ